MKVRENKFLLKPHMRLNGRLQNCPKIVLLLQNKETWCRCQWFWGFQRAGGFQNLWGAARLWFFAAFVSRGASAWPGAGRGRKKLALGGLPQGFWGVSTRGMASKPLGRCTAPWANSFWAGNLVAMQTRGIVAGAHQSKRALQTAFFPPMQRGKSNNRRMKICGTKFKEKKNNEKKKN